LDIFDEDEEEEDDYEAEIDRQEEENLEAYQNQPYLYRVSFCFKGFIRDRPYQAG
jgi:hypothetical protein